MTTGKSIFRKAAPARADRIAAVEAAVDGVPIVGDPRITPAQPAPPLLSVGTVAEVPVERIRSNPLNPRAVYPVQAIEEMAEELRRNGQRVPATGFIGSDGDVVLIEGETRLRGAKFAGLKTLRIEIRERPSTDLELDKHARDANVRRRDQTPLDDALRWKDLLEQGIFKGQAHLAQELGLSESTVSRTLALADLPALVVRVVAEHPGLMNLSMLNAIRNYCATHGPEATIEYVGKIERAGLGYRQVEEDAKPAASPSTRPRASKETIKFGSAKGEIKRCEKGGRVEIKFEDLTAEQAAEVVSRIKGLCSG